MTGNELVKLLKKDGWRLDRVRGSHHILIKGKELISVPVHVGQDLGKGILYDLMKQAGLK